MRWTEQELAAHNAKRGAVVPIKARIPARGPLAFTLPWPPSSNRYWRNYRGVVVKSDEARAYKRQVEDVLAACAFRQLEGPVSIWLDFFRPRQAGDLDNRIKILLDALQGLAYADDKQIVEIHARRFEDKANPRVEVTIEATRQPEPEIPPATVAL